MSVLRALARAGAVADEQELDRYERGRRRDLEQLKTFDKLGEFDTVSPLYAFLAGRSRAGKTVTVESAFTLTAVYAAIRILADTVASLPLQVFARSRGGGHQEAWYDPTYTLLHDTPNGEMTAATVWSLVMTHLNAWGDAFLGKEFSAGKLVGLWPIKPDQVRVERQNGVKLYWIRDNLGRENPTPYTDDDVVHIMGMSIDGIRGMSPISLAREAFGAGLALEEYANVFWANSALPALAVTIGKDVELADDARDRFERRWRRKFKGSRNAGKVAFLEDGMDIKGISMPLADAQFVEQQKWSIQQAARVFRVPLSLIAGEAVDSSLTYRTVEGDGIHFLTHSVQPWLVRIEQALRRDNDLFPRPALYPKFNFDSLLRADIKVRSAALALATGNRAWMLPSEARAGEGLPPDKSLDALPPSKTPAAGGGSDNGDTGPR